MPKLLTTSLAALLLGLFAAQALVFIGASSQTSDEAVHLAAGHSYLSQRDFRLNPEHPALMKELAALPLVLSDRVVFEPDPELWRRAEQWRIGRDFLYRQDLDWRTLLTWGRLPILACGMVLVALVGWWAHRLWGPRAGLVAMALASVEPNLIAHSALVTTDLGATLFVFAAVYALWEYGNAPSAPRAAGLGVVTGLALAAKYSTVILPALLVALAAGRQLLEAGPRVSRDAALRFVRASVIAGAVAACVLIAVYLVGGIGTWWAGLLQVLSHGAQGHAAWFLGEHSERGWASYFAVAFAIKTAPGTLLLVAASLALPRAGVALDRRTALYLWLPALAWFAVATAGGINIGVRHVLPVYPFLFVAASRLATLRLASPFATAALLIVPLGLSAVSSLRAAPHYLAYFNEAAGGPANGHRWLSDSNLDWGQDLGGLRAWMDREGLPAIYLSYFGNPPPGAHGIRYQYAPAWGALEPPPPTLLAVGAPRQVLAISVMSLHGVRFRNPDLYGWLREREPIATIGHSIHLYDLTGDADAHRQLAEVYLEAGMPRFAAAELRQVLHVRPDDTEARLRLEDLPAARSPGASRTAPPGS